MRTAKSFPGWISSTAWTPYTPQQPEKWHRFRQRKHTLMILVRHLLLALVFAGLVVSSAGAGTFPDARSQPPAEWKGPVFRLSQDYPKTLPFPEALAFFDIDFKREPAAYLHAVLAYVLEGNLTSGKPNAPWAIQDNPVRTWYHAPWMHYGERGREFIHGLTRERTSCPGELANEQSDWQQNWAVGFYNAPGGYVIGQVWQAPLAPDIAKTRFPVGTVAAKLLFTAAPVSQVPYLEGAPTWQANINTSTRSEERKPQEVRLIQFDVAVRDARANATTGWVFGTFVYDGKQPGDDPWKKLVPSGLMWGDDPTVASARLYKEGEFNPDLKESWLNTAMRTKQHYGRGGRLNGPLDSSASSCISCHATAQVPALSDIVPQPPSPRCGPLVDDWAQQKRWFRNIKAGEPFDPAAASADYSLQIAVGIANFDQWRSNLGTVPHRGE